MEKESEARVRRGGGDDIFLEYIETPLFTFLIFSYLFPSLLSILFGCSCSPSAVVVN